MSLHAQPGAPAATEDYFRLLADRARVAGEQGNYAIAAALAIRADGREVVFEGWNTLFAEHDPSGHAEMNAIRLAHAVATLPDPRSVPVVEHARRQGALRHYDRPGGRAESVLYTTLEPCPMCTVCLINAGVGRVVVGAADPPSGTLEAGRLARLPPVWPELAAAGGLAVTFCQSTEPDSIETFLPPQLRQELLDRFAASRARLDASLGAEGVIDFARASESALRLLRDP